MRSYRHVFFTPTVSYSSIHIPDQSIRPGSLIGEYRVTEQIGEGGMGIVYAATHPIIGKQVAIKVLKAHVAGERNVVMRFVREARSVNQICHPNIIDVFGFGQLDNGRHYFIMEYLQGETLEDKLERNARLSLEESLPLFRQVADAVDAAHRRQVVHRDLKPENIFLMDKGNGDPTVKVLDFGIAKLGEQGVHRTQAGLIMGTPLFMSPEQCRGETVDSRTDIYAFGVTVYRALTGRYPIEGESVSSIIFHQVASVPIPPSALGAPPELDEAIAAALDKDPSKRYGTLGAVVDALANLGQGDAKRFDAAWGNVTPIATGRITAGNEAVVAAEPAFVPGSTQRIQQGKTSAEGKPKRRNQDLPTTGRLAGAGPVTCRGHRGGVSQLAYAPAGDLFASAGEDATVRIWDREGRSLAVLKHSDKVDYVTFAPQGHLVASGSVDGSVWLWSIYADKPVRVVKQKSAVTCLAFSPDNGGVATGHGDGTVRVLDVATGESRLLRGHSAAVRTIQYSPSGSTIASAGDDKTVRLWQHDSGARRVFYGHTRSVSAVTFSLDGAYVASASQDGTLREWRISDGDCNTYSGGRESFRDIAYSPDGKLIAGASSQRTIVLWGRRGQYVTLLRGHEKRVRKIAFSQDGSRLASASTDGSVRIWNMDTRRCEATITHGGAVRHVEFSPDGRWLASASSQSQILLTPMARRPPKKQAKRSVARASVEVHKRHLRPGFVVAAGIVGVAVAALYVLGILPL